ncbi:hypothetical protein [Streptomyces sp. NPDC059709]|uniref:hypothetical protein n=1 Tax=Streptomyces sp. NPDC059709 TaxID=3346917 RepID=UPI003679D030
MPELLRTAEGERVEVHILDEYEGEAREVEINGERCWLLVDICTQFSFRRAKAREPEWREANCRRDCLRPVIYSISSRTYYVHGYAINAEGVERLGGMSTRSWKLPRQPYGVRKAVAR